MNSSHRADDMKSHLEMSPLRNKSLPLRPPGGLITDGNETEMFLYSWGKDWKTY